MIKLSAYVVTLNEEKRLAKTLKALSKVADEIVVVDSGSTDKTREIAEKYGAKFLFNKWKNISNQKNFAQNKCTNDWVLSVDADEVLSNELIKEINNVKKNPTADAYWIKISDMMPGCDKPSRLAKYYNLIRLYNKTKANMPDDFTNDRIVLGNEAKTMQLKGKVLHFSYISLSQYWLKLNTYTDELLKTAIVQNRKYTRLRLITEFPRQFIVYYFIKRYFVYGLAGFWMSNTLAYFRFLKIAKWFEYKAENKVKI